MSAASKPWMKFYPQDWRADEKLRMCSLAARGLWMEMLAIMHRSERYGQLLISGHVPTDAQLAVQVGASESEVTAMLAELGGAGVFSRTTSGAIYSRRMTRDGKKAETARKNGKTGGNPNLRKQREKSASDKGADKTSVKGGVNTQRPEARGQRPEEEKLRQSSVTARDPDPPPSLHEQRCRSLASTIGLTRPIAEADRAQLRQWLADGLDFDFHVLEAAKGVAAREHGRGRAVGSFRYLDGPVREYAAEWHADRESYKQTAANT